MPWPQSRPTNLESLLPTRSIFTNSVFDSNAQLSWKTIGPDDSECHLINGQEASKNHLQATEIMFKMVVTYLDELKHVLTHIVAETV